MDTLNVEYVWESFAAMEADFEKLTADPEYQNIWAKYPDVIIDTRFEIYTILPS